MTKRHPSRTDLLVPEVGDDLAVPLGSIFTIRDVHGGVAYAGTCSYPLDSLVWDAELAAWVTELERKRVRR